VRLLAVRAIFRVVWEAEQAFPPAPQFCPSSDALVVDWLDAGCSPRDAETPAAVDVPAPDDCARELRPGSSVQIALGCAAGVTSIVLGKRVPFFQSTLVVTQ
jgi:hypothetical protein